MSETIESFLCLITAMDGRSEFMATDVIFFVDVYLFYIDTMLYIMEKMFNNVCPILV